MTSLKYPIRGEVYTVKQIDEDLYLRDSAFLRFFDENGETQVVQTSHIAENLSSWPEWAELRFTYQRETEEWIPLFFVVSDDNEKLLNLVQRRDSGHGDEWSISYHPKAFPRD